MLKKGLLFGVALIVATLMACGGDKNNTVAPTSTAVDGTEAASDGSTLKVTAPTPTSPTNGVTLDSRATTLIVTNASGTYVTPSNLKYRFVVETAAGATVLTSGQITAGTSSTSYAIADKILSFATTYRWRARAEQGSLVGPWSSYFAFTTVTKIDPYELEGYITANALWDPLTKGKTVGEASNMEFTTGMGARTISNESLIRYTLLQTLTAGEFSFYVYNFNPLSVGDKTKFMSMEEGYSDITTNDYRFTVEKRGATYPTPGQIRIRIINGDSGSPASVHDSSPTVPSLVKNVWYYVRLTWGSNLANLSIYTADATGTTGTSGSRVVNVSVGYPGRQYGPTPHVCYVGAPTGRAGSQDQSVPNMTVKGVYIGTVGARPTGSDEIPDMQ
jgi:hypothetical protein